MWVINPIPANIWGLRWLQGSMYLYYWVYFGDSLIVGVITLVKIAKNKKTITQGYKNKTMGNKQSRVSKSGRHADAHLRKTFHKVRKILAFERTIVKITYFNQILLILTHFFCVHLLLSFDLGIESLEISTEFLKVADTQTHACAQISTNCSKFWLLNAKLWKLPI